MPRKFKFGTYSPDEVDLLLAIPRGPNQQRELDKFARTHNRNPRNVYLKWWELVIRKKGASKHLMTALKSLSDVKIVPAGKGKNMPLYVLEDGAEGIRRGPINPKLEKDLATLAPVMLPFGTIANGKLTRHTIPILKAEKSFALKWLAANIPDKKFGATIVHDNPNAVRILRKS